MTNPPNDINTLMSRIDAINAKSPRELTDADLDDLILYHRRNRARKAAGEKMDKPQRPTVDLAALLNLPTAKPASNATIITRRI